MTPFSVTRIRYRLARTPLRAVVVGARHLGLRRSDCYLGAYPRSGSTWLKFLLYEALSGESAGFANSSAAIPHVGRHWKAPALVPGGRRLIKTHEAHRSEYGRAIYVVRDFRDVVRSEHAFFTWRGMIDGMDFDDFLDRSLSGNSHGFGFGSWIAHVESWIDARDRGDAEVLLVRYEDMRDDPESGLAGMLAFLGATATAEQVSAIVRNNALSRMRQKEDAVRDEHAPFRTPDRRYEGGLRFVRQGSVGGWKDELSQDQVRRIESRTAGLLSRLGYPVTVA